MDKLLRFLEKLEEYKEIKSAVNIEPDDISFPSERRERLWAVERNLRESFRNAVKEALGMG